MDMMANIWTNLSLFMPMDPSLLNSMMDSYTIVRVMKHNERTLFGEIVDSGGVKQFAPLAGTLKVAVYYGNVANLTFISDFILEIGEC